MQRNDFADFSAMLSDVWSLKGQALSPNQIAVFFRALVAYPLHEVRAGIDAHVKDPKRGQFLPMPADVIAQITEIVAADGRPGPEEAWALALRSRDERVTVVWTSETSEAMGIAQPLLQAGDDVGARMAFKEAYTRLVGAAREARRAPAWTASLGYNASERDSVLLPHVQAGRLSADLLTGKAPELGQLFLLAAPENASPATLQVREKALADLAALREKWRNELPPTSRGELERQRTVALKAESAKRVSEYVAGGAA